MNEFDRKAEEWDADPVRIERAQAVAEGIRGAVPLDPSMAALEYGCGTGLLSFALQPYLRHMTLADSSLGMLAVLERKIAAGGIHNMTPLRWDLLSDPLPRERFQLIYTLLTLHHIAETEKVLRTFYALLDSPGYLCVADLDTEDGGFHGEGFRGHLGFDRDALGAQARQAGFRTVQFTTPFQMVKDVQGASRSFSMFLLVARKDDPFLESANGSGDHARLPAAGG